MAFQLDERLARDTVEIGRLDLCRVLLSRDAGFPWLILVPEREGLREIVDLPRNDRIKLMDEIAFATEGMQRMFKPDKMNVAALGNAVPQLHVHVIARSTADRAWPKPVWGAGEPQAYDAAALTVRVKRLRTALSERPVARRPART